MIDRIVAAALGSVAAAAIVAAGVQNVRLNAAQHTLADLRVAIAEEHDREAREAAAASEAAREVERLRQSAIKEIVDEAQDRARAAGLDAALGLVFLSGLISIPTNCYLFLVFNLYFKYKSLFAILFIKTHGKRFLQRSKVRQITEAQSD